MTAVGARASGVGPIGVATIVAGLAGYAVTWVVFRALGAADYSVFAVFWAITYLLVGALSGIQQEVTRATRRRPDSAPAPATARDFAVLTSGVVLVVVLVATPLWTGLAFPGESWHLVLPLAAATASYAVVAVAAGVLSGLAVWRVVALMVVLDGLLRLALVSLAALLWPDPAVLGWAVALPFPISVVVAWLVARRRLVGRFVLDVSLRTLTWNVSRTVVAAAATGILVSGFPFVLRLTSHEVPAERLGVVILALTLVRAPLIISAMSLQSLFIVRFREAPDPRTGVLALLGLVAGGGLVLAVLGWLVGPAVFLLLFGPEAVVDGGFVAVIALSSTLIAAMFVTGPALLAPGRHTAYTGGWVLAAAASVLLLLLPIPFDARLAVAVIGAPALGVVMHAVGLARLGRPAGDPA